MNAKIKILILVILAIFIVGFVAGFYLAKPKADPSLVVKALQTEQTTMAIPGQPVKWVAIVKRQDIKDTSHLVQLPKSATGIKAESVAEKQKNDILAQSSKNAVAEVTNSNPVFTADLLAGVKNLLGNTFSGFAEIFNTKITSSSVAKFFDVGKQNGQQDYVVVQYQTPGPTKEEKYVPRGKEITFKEPKDVNYTNVLGYASVPEKYSLKEEQNIKVKWMNTGKYVDFKAFDKNNNGKVDYIEWSVPHLSDEIYDIIYISKAEKLDANKNPVEDIYEKVKAQDKNYATVSGGQYVRVAFEKILTTKNDITVYARPAAAGTSPEPVEGQAASIQVYPVYTDANGNQAEGPKLTTVSDGTNSDFSNISTDGKYRILLQNLQTPTDVFDLRVIASGSEAISGVDIDYIVDPATCNSPAGGNWNTAGTWDCGHVPTTGDAVVITASQNVTMDVASAVLGTITVNGTLNTITSGTSYNLTGTTLTIGSAGVLTANNSTITLSGTGTVFTITAGGVFTYGTSTISYTGNGDTTVLGTTYYNLTVGNATLSAARTYTLSAATTVTNVCNIGPATTNTATLDIHPYTLTFSGTGTPLVINSNGLFLGTGNSAALSYTGNGATTITGVSLYNLYVGYYGSQTAGRTYTLGGDITVGNTLYIGPSSGSYTQTLDGSSYTITLNRSNQFGWSIGTMGAFTASTSTVITSGKQAYVAIAVPVATFYNLQLIGPAYNSNSFTLSGSVTVSGTLTITGNSAANRLLITSNTLGTARTITISSATVSIADADFEDITFGGTAGSWSGTRVGDAGGNSGTSWSPTATDTETWDGSAANWSSAHWTGVSVNRVPLPQDTVVLAGTNTVTADMPRLGKDISFSAAAKLTLSTAVTSYGSVNFTNAGTFTPSSQIWIFESSARTGTLTLTSNSKTFSGVTVQMPGATLALGDAFNSTGTLTVSNGTLAVGTNNLAVTGTSTVTGGTLTIGASSSTGWTTAGLTIGTGGTVTCSGASKITDSGDWVSSAGTFTRSTSTVTLTGTGPNNLTLAASAYNTGNFDTLIINGNYNLTASSYIIGSAAATAVLTLGTGATLNMNTSVTGQTWSNYGATMSIGSGATLGGLGAFTYTFTSGYATTTPITNSGTISVATFTYTLAGNAVVTIPATSYGGNLSIGTYNAASVTVKVGTGTMTVGGNLTVSNGTAGQTTTFDASVNNNTINVAGNWAFGTRGVFTSGTSTVIFTKASGTQTVTSNNGTSTQPFSSLTHSGAGTLQLADAVDVNGAFLNSSSAFDSNTKNMNFAGNWSNTGSATFTRSSGTLTFDGTTTLTNSSSGAATLAAVAISGTVTLGSNATITSCSGAGTLNAGAGSYTLTVSGTTSPFAVTTFQKGTGSTVKYTGTSATNVAVVAYNNLELAGATTYSLAGNLTSTNAITGNLKIDSGATLDAVNGSNYGITLAGNWSNSGTFTARSGTVTLNGVNQNILGATTFFNLTKDVSAASASTLMFENSQTQSIANSGTLTLKGGLGKVLTLRSCNSSGLESDGTQWLIGVSNTGTALSVDYVNVKDSNASIKAIIATNTIDSGNNTNWSGPAANPRVMIIKGGLKIKGDVKVK